MYTDAHLIQDIRLICANAHKYPNCCAGPKITFYSIFVNETKLFVFCIYAKIH